MARYNNKVFKGLQCFAVGLKYTVDRLVERKRPSRDAKDQGSAFRLLL
jgi:hypothetical protein